MHDTCLHIYIPCTSPVQAGEYRDTSSLTEFGEWVNRYRARGLVPDDVRFTIEQRDQLTVGLLHTPLGNSDMHVGDFLVFTGRTFFISSAADFWRDYRDPDDAITLPRIDPPG